MSIPIIVTPPTIDNINLDIKIPIISTSWSKVFVPYFTRKDTSDFVRVYRFIIDYINPVLDYKETIESSFGNIGIPILIYDPEINEHIDTYNDTSYIEDYLNGIVTTNAPESALGYSWITSIDGKQNFMNYRQNYGTNHSKRLGNIYGRKLIIKRLSRRNYRQIYEFVGAKNKSYESIDVGILLPAYKNSTNEYIYSTIKNISFSCDTLTSNDYDLNYTTESNYIAYENKITIDDGRE